METADFFRSRIDAMVNLSDPLAVLARRLPWALRRLVWNANPQLAAAGAKGCVGKSLSLDIRKYAMAMKLVAVR